jgi:hypothetical protein
LIEATKKLMGALMRMTPKPQDEMEAAKKKEKRKAKYQDSRHQKPTH